MRQTLETCSSSNDSVLNDLLCHLWNFWDQFKLKSGSIFEELNTCTVITSNTGLIHTRNSITSKEDTPTSTNKNVSLKTQELSMTRSGSDGQLRGCFCSEVVRDLSSKVLPVLRISFLGLGLGFCSTSTFKSSWSQKMLCRKFS